MKIPVQQTTKMLIETTEIIEGEPRGYLGMSSIGDPCERKLWYGFHFASEKKAPDPRGQRIFNMGDYVEEAIIAELKRVGMEVFRRDPETGDKIELIGFRGEQQDVCVGVAGHFLGHTDGRVLGVVEAPRTEHLLEAKSHNEKNFKALEKDGVKKAFPKHFAQMQIYMRKQKLTRSLYVGMNKNTCELYIERVYYDEDFAKDLENKATGIILSPEPPPKKFAPTWIECCGRGSWTGCGHFSTCHGNQTPRMGCRTCTEANICEDGEWECGLDDRKLTIKEQLRGCEFYVMGWGLGKQD